MFSPFQVLKASKNKPHDNNVANGVDPKASSMNGTHANKTNHELDEPIIKKKRILEKITYDDLEDSSENKNKSNQQLNLSKVD